MHFFSDFSPLLCGTYPCNFSQRVAFPWQQRWKWWYTARKSNYPKLRQFYPWLKWANSKWARIWLTWTHEAEIRQIFKHYICSMDILFSSNHNIHKSSCGLCFWASDPFIDRYYVNLSIKESEAQKQRPKDLLWMLWFDEKSISKSTHILHMLADSELLEKPSFLPHLIVWQD